MPSCFVSNPSGASCDEGYVIGSFVGVGAGAVGVAEALGIGDADCVAAGIFVCTTILSCFGVVTVIFTFADFFGGFLNLFLHGYCCLSLFFSGYSSFFINGSSLFVGRFEKINCFLTFIFNLYFSLFACFHIKPG